MMRYQRVSPDCLVLPSGRKATLKSFKDADDADARISKDNYPPFDAKPLRVRSGSGSASGSANPAAQTHDPQTHDHHETNGRCSDVLLQWGHNKRSRGSRADSHRTAGDESSAHQRQHVKIQRRAAIAGAERIAAAAAAAAMPPPCGGGYSRGSNLRACMPSRDSTSTHQNRTVEDRSNGHHRPDKRSPPSPPEKPAAHSHGKAAAAASNGFGSDPSSSSMSQHPDPKHRSDHDDAAGSGSGGPTPAAEKVSLQHLEWPRIYVSLSRKEKEDDFLAMKGTKLPQRPKKRAKNIDKSLQYVFPGMWLSDLTRGRYEVREKKCAKKKRRGLKGMESMESDSE